MIGSPQIRPPTQPQPGEAKEREPRPSAERTALLARRSETHNQSVAQPKFDVVAVQERPRLLNGLVVIDSFDHTRRQVDIAFCGYGTQAIRFHDLTDSLTSIS